LDGKAKHFPPFLPFPAPVFTLLPLLLLRNAFFCQGSPWPDESKGDNHAIYANGPKTIPVKRHNNLDRITSNEIHKQAGLSPKF
jgi:hypothetical protein